MTALPGARPAVTDGALFVKLLKKSGSGEAKLEVCRVVLREAAAEIPPRRGTAEECYEAMAADPTIFDGTLEKARLIILTGQWKKPDEPAALSIEDELLAPGCPILSADFDDDDLDDHARGPRAYERDRPRPQTSSTMGPQGAFGAGELAPYPAGPQRPHGEPRPHQRPGAFPASLDRPSANPPASSPGLSPDGPDAGGVGGVVGGVHYGTHAVGTHDPSLIQAGPVPGDNVRTIDATGPGAGIGTPPAGSESAPSSRSVPITAPGADTGAGEGTETGAGEGTGDGAGAGEGDDAAAGSGAPPGDDKDKDKDKDKHHGSRGRHTKRN